jgi:hypothetical protein
MFLFPNKLDQPAYANAKSGSNLNNQRLTILNLNDQMVNLFYLSPNMVK